MKRIKTYWSGLLLLALTVFAVSCDNNDEIAVDPDADFDAVLDVSQTGAANPNKDVTVNANTLATIKAKIHFTATSVDMKRLYITQNIKAQGETAYKPTESVDLKQDGAIDLTGKNSKDFEFQFELPVPSGVGTGTVVYKFWTTTGNGDFRDQTQRLAVGPGTITLKYGTATNPEAPVKTFSSVKLFAPTADGLSKTFVSLLDGKTYDVKSGSEYAAFWDFGYIYRMSTDPKFAGFTSTSEYPTIAVDVPTVSGTPKDELNKTRFVLSSITATQFDAITTTTQLNAVTASASSGQSIGGLAVGSVVEFFDNVGKKGYIKVKEQSGTNGIDGYITIDIKIQP